MQRNGKSQSADDPQPTMHSHVDIVYLISYINCKAWEYQMDYGARLRVRKNLCRCIQIKSRKEA